MNAVQMNRFIVLAAAVCAGAAAPAPGQQTEYTLTPGGEWAQTDGPAPGSDEAVIADARRLLAEERFGDARSIADRFIEQKKRTDSPMLPAAYLVRADAKSASGNEFKAISDYEIVISQFPAAPEYVTAVERELEIALQYLYGRNRKMLGLRILSGEKLGQEIMLRVNERMPGSRLAERAVIELGDYYFRKRELKSAAIVYEKFLDNFPNSEYRMHAMARRAHATIFQYKGPRYDGAAASDGRILAGRFQRLYPAQADREGLGDAQMVVLDERIATKLLISARWYRDRGDGPSARYVYQRLLAAHGGTVAAMEAMDDMEAKGWTVDAMRAPALGGPAEVVEPAAPPAPPDAPPPSPGEAEEARP